MVRIVISQLISAVQHVPFQILLLPANNRVYLMPHNLKKHIQDQRCIFYPFYERRQFQPGKDSSLIKRNNQVHSQAALPIGLCLLQQKMLPFISFFNVILFCVYTVFLSSPCFYLFPFPGNKHPKKCLLRKNRWSKQSFQIRKPQFFPNNTVVDQ